MSTSQVPKVFISYSHDSEEHRNNVFGLAASLNRDGCTCCLDVVKDTNEDWPSWMTRELIESDFILCICTDTYHRRFRDQEMPDIGLGVGWEAGLIRRLLYSQKLRNGRIYPVLIASSNRQYIPLELHGYDFYTLDVNDGYKNLLCKIHGHKSVVLPLIGQKPEMSTRQVEPKYQRPDQSPPDPPQTEGPSYASPPDEAVSNWPSDAQNSIWNEIRDVLADTEHRALESAWKKRSELVDSTNVAGLIDHLRKQPLNQCFGDLHQLREDGGLKVAKSIELVNGWLLLLVHDYHRLTGDNSGNELRMPPVGTAYGYDHIAAEVAAKASQKGRQPAQLMKCGKQLVGRRCVSPSVPRPVLADTLEHIKTCIANITRPEDPSSVHVNDALSGARSAKNPYYIVIPKDASSLKAEIKKGLPDLLMITIDPDAPGLLHDPALRGGILSLVFHLVG